MNEQLDNGIMNFDDIIPPGKITMIYSEQISCGKSWFSMAYAKELASRGIPTMLVDSHNGAQRLGERSKRYIPQVGNDWDRKTYNLFASQKDDLAYEIPGVLLSQMNLCTVTPDVVVLDRVLDLMKGYHQSYAQKLGNIMRSFTGHIGKTFLLTHFTNDKGGIFGGDAFANSLADNFLIFRMEQKSATELHFILFQRAGTEELPRAKFVLKFFEDGTCQMARVTV